MQDTGHWNDSICFSAYNLVGLNATITQEPQVIENIKLLVEPYKSNPF